MASPFTLHTEIEIAARPERVWQILTDFGAFPQWNPFILAIEGEPKVGTRLKATMRPQGGSAMTFTPTVVTAEQNRMFSWLGHFLFPGLLDAEHVFRIEPVEGAHVRFVHEENFRGLLVPLFRKQLETGTRASFIAMNEALKERACSDSRPEGE